MSEWIKEFNVLQSSLKIIDQSNTIFHLWHMFLTVVETQNESINNGFDYKHGARVPIVTFHYQSLVINAN